MGNIGSLAVFKYAGFIAQNIDRATAAVGWSTSLSANIPPFMLILPVGISFYTFQSMSYTIDVYKGSLKPTTNLMHFFAYLAMFPQLVAGPIIRASSLLPQLTSFTVPAEKAVWRGTKLIIHGYFKKVIIADNLAPAVNQAFASAGQHDDTLYWWIIISMFAFQIYCDFSGYSDIARGLAKWMGYDFALNFNHPYVATSFKDFWSRWHISLSTWFRDYVYIPLGGSRHGHLKAYLTMTTTMVVSGLWHGAAWTFVLWGALHGLFLGLERATKWPQRLGRLTGGRIVSNIVVLVGVWLSWVVFRGESLRQVGHIISCMCWPRATGERVPLVFLVFLAVAILREVQVGSGLSPSTLFGERLWNRLEPYVLALVVAATLFFRGPGSAFIYFQF